MPRRTAVRFAGMPMRRPAPSPVMSFDMFSAKVAEFTRLHAQLIAHIDTVKKAHAAFEAVKTGPQGKRGVPGADPTGAQIEAAVKKLVRQPLDGKSVTQVEVEATVQKYLAQPKNGETPEPQNIVEVLLQSPKFERLLKKHLKAGKDGTSPATDALVAMVMEQLKTKKVTLGDIEGIDQKFAELRGHINASKDWRGGGDTVEAGTNVTITSTVNGRKKINASGGVGAWSTPVEVPDSVITVFTVGTPAPTDVVADGVNYYNGAGYTYAAGQITFDNPPAQYVRYR